MKQELVLEQKKKLEKASDILQYMFFEKGTRRIFSQFSDGSGGYCAMGAIMNYLGWDGGNHPTGKFNIDYIFSHFSEKANRLTAGVPVIAYNDSGHPIEMIIERLREKGL